MIDWFEQFVETGQYESAAGILIKLDEIIRHFSHGDWDTLIENSDAFRQRVGDLMLLVAKQNLDACTVSETCKHYGKVGTVPKWKGEPSITHIVHQVRPYSKKDMGLIDRVGQE